MLADVVSEWPRVNNLAVRKHLVPPQNPGTGPMPVVFANFLLKDVRGLKSESRVNHAVRCMSKPIVNNMLPT